MPLKRWFESHGLPPWYSWLVVIGLTLSSNVLTLIIVLQLSGRAVESERAAREAAAAVAASAGEVNRRAFCLVIETQEEVFSDAATPVGRKAGAAWNELGKIFQCEK